MVFEELQELIVDMLDVDASEIEMVTSKTLSNNKHITELKSQGA